MNDNTGKVLENMLHISVDKELMFNQNPNEESFSTVLDLQNIGTEKVAFKIKTTAPRNYLVRPNQGVLTPNESMTIKIQMNSANATGNQSVLNDKFMVQALPTILEHSETEALNELWKNARKEEVKQHKLKVMVPAAFLQGGQSVTNTRASLDRGINVYASQNFPSNTPAAGNENTRHTIFEESSGELSKISVGASVTEGHSVGAFGPKQSSIGNSEIGNIHKHPDYQKLNDEYNVLASRYMAEKKDKEELRKEIEKLTDARQLSDNKRSAMTNAGNTAVSQAEGYQMIHLIITAIVCLLIGAFLGRS